MFIGLTGSNSGVFRALGFIVSPVGIGERRKNRKGEGKEGKRSRKGKDGRMGGRSNKKRSEER